MANTVKVADKLGANKFHTDEHNAHIKIDKDFVTKDLEEVKKIVRACPAELYTISDDNSTVFFEYLGCLECGTCRVLSEDKLITDWDYPLGTLGIEYRLG